MDRHQHEQARSCYRGLRVTLTAAPTGLLTWNLWVKPAEARWNAYQWVAGGEVRKGPDLTSTPQATRVLVNLLEEHLAHLSGPSV